MFPESLTFQLVKRVVRGDDQWALYAQFDNELPWVVQEYYKKPSDERILEDKKLAERMCEVSYKHIKVPMYGGIKLSRSVLTGTQVSDE